MTWLSFGTLITNFLIRSDVWRQNGQSTLCNPHHMVNSSPCPHTLLTSTLPGNICQINETSLQSTYTQSAVEKRDVQKKTKLLLIQNTACLTQNLVLKEVTNTPVFLFFSLSWREKWDKKELLRRKTKTNKQKSPVQIPLECSVKRSEQFRKTV